MLRLTIVLEDLIPIKQHVLCLNKLLKKRALLFSFFALVCLAEIIYASSTSCHHLPSVSSLFGCLEWICLIKCRPLDFPSQPPPLTLSLNFFFFFFLKVHTQKKLSTKRIRRKMDIDKDEKDLFCKLRNFSFSHSHSWKFLRQIFSWKFFYEHDWMIQSWKKFIYNFYFST